VKDQGNGRQSVLKRTYLTLFHGEAFNYRALIISVATIVLAVVLRRLVKRFGLPQLDLLATLIFAALIAYLAGWATEDHTGNTAIKLTAKIPQSLPHPHIPSVQLNEVTQLAPGALAIAFIGLLEALVDRQSHRLPERSEDRLQPADHRRRPGEPHRRFSSRPCRARVR